MTTPPPEIELNDFDQAAANFDETYSYEMFLVFSGRKFEFTAYNRIEDNRTLQRYTDFKNPVGRFSGTLTGWEVSAGPKFCCWVVCDEDNEQRYTEWTQGDWVFEPIEPVGQVEPVGEIDSVETDSPGADSPEVVEQSHSQFADSFTSSSSSETVDSSGSAGPE